MGNPRTDWMMRTDDGARPQRPLAGLSARQGAGRLHRDQRHDLHARPGGRLRPLAPARQCRLGLGRRPALLPEVRGQFPRRERRCTAPAANGRSRASGCAGTSSRPSATPPRRSASRAATTSTTATTRARASSRSTSGTASAGPRRRPFCAPRATRPNLRVVTGALVTGVVLDGRRATGVRYRADGRSGRPAADGEVILAAGAINSPKLLELSGIGDPEVLGAARHRGASRAARGRARTCRITCRSGRSSASPARARSTSSPTAASARRRWRSSTRSSAAGRCRWRRASSASSRAATRRWRRRTSSTTSSRCRPTSSATRCTAFPAVTVSVCNLRPESRGTCHIRSRDPAEQPAIRLNYLSAATRPGRRAQGRPPGATAGRRRGASPLRAAGDAARARRSTADADLLARHRQHRHDDLPSRRHLPDGQRRTCRRRRRRCASAASTACASSTPRSCRRSPRATPPRRSS